jgi:hypothetical protein
MTLAGFTDRAINLQRRQGCSTLNVLAVLRLFDFFHTFELRKQHARRQIPLEIKRGLTHEAAKKSAKRFLSRVENCFKFKKTISALSMIF